MAFPPQFLDEIRARVPLSEVVGSGVRLQRRGAEYVGLCPFHQEKTPSFTVVESKGFYHCFGCGAHGDVIRYVMESEKLSFPETVERLAGRAGLAMPERSPAQRERERRVATLHDVLEEACEWFRRQLAGKAGAGARDYLAGRGVERGTWERFRLGYAPEGPRGLIRHLETRGIARDLMAEAGLIAGGRDGREPVDRFRQRLVFPIGDRGGRTVGFGGRAMDDHPAKYLNSPETPVFHKGHVLYGFAEARKPAHDAGTVIVVEGYMDTVVLSQAGLRHVVAPLGTALTEGHLALLWSMADEPVLCFDGDTAGYQAACRAVDRAFPVLKAGKSLRFALLSGGQDPDDLVRARGAGAMREVIDGAIPLMDMFWRSRTLGQSFATPERRAALERDLMVSSERIADTTVRHYYRGEIRQRLRDAFAGSWSSDRRRRMRQRGRLDRRRMDVWSHGRSVEVTPRLPGGPAGPRGMAERALIALPLLNPGLLERVAESLAAVTFVDPRHESMQKCLVDALGSGENLDSAALADHLKAAGLAGLLKEISGTAAASLYVIDSVDMAESLWRHAHELHQCRDVLGEEIHADAGAWEDNPTDEAWQRLIAKVVEREGWQARVPASGNDG